MPCLSHKWIWMSCNPNSKGYIRIVQNSVFIRKNPREQMILAPRKLLLLHVCDCNRLRTKIDGFSAHQVPLRLWKSRAWITHFTFCKSIGTNIKQNQQKKSAHSLSVQHSVLAATLFSQCIWQNCRVAVPRGTLSFSLGEEQEREKHKLLLQCRLPEWSSVIHLIPLWINSIL